jgi:alpha-ketoglutarate-dependent taurine dioxygenase
MSGTGSLRVDAAVPVPMLEHIVEGPRAWRASTISESDWLISIPNACLDELETALEQLRMDHLPMLMLDPREFHLPACSDLMSAVRRRLDEECGIVVLDRLPVESYDLEQTRTVFWFLGALLGRPVSQSLAGEIMVDVTDTGIKKAIGVRGFRTNAGQPPHIDNSFNASPPDYVSLLGLRKAARGGVSKFVSFYTVHNELMHRHPELLPRLYRGFYQDRQGDFQPGEPQTVFYPIFEYGEILTARYTHFTIPAGYQTAGVPFDGESREAFEAMSRIVDDPALYCSLVIEPGQLQVVNNRSFGHGRTDYEDPEDRELRRHLLRLWHRDWGRRSYSG